MITLAYADDLMNHCLRIFFSTRAPERHDLPLSSICSLANTVLSTGSQLTSAFYLVRFERHDRNLLFTRKVTNVRHTSF